MLAFPFIFTLLQRNEGNDKGSKLQLDIILAEYILPRLQQAEISHQTNVAVQ